MNPPAETPHEERSVFALLLRRIETAAARIVGAGTVIGCLLLALVEFGNAAVGDFEQKLARGQKFTAESARRFLKEPPRWVAIRDCRRDTALIKGRIASEVVDALIEDGALTEIEPAIRHLREVSRQILRCNPREGLVWAWRAMADDELGASDREIRDDFDISVMFTPSELLVVSMRLPAAARIRSRRGDLFVPPVERDLHALFVADDDPWTAATIVAPAFVWITNEARRAYAEIEDPTRRENLFRTFGARGANIAGCEKKAFNNWLFRGMRDDCRISSRIPDFELRFK